MNRLIIAATTSLLTTPAFAHEGPHLHPHGTELLWAVLAMGLIAGYAVWLTKGRGQ